MTTVPIPLDRTFLDRHAHGTELILSGLGPLETDSESDPRPS